MIAGAGVKWVGFHLFTSEPFEPLLVGCLAPGFEEARREGTVRRFFFLRYSEGGLHLRLRVLPGGRGRAEGVRAFLEERLHAWSPSGGWRLESHPYDRTALYFGETPESVHAELLNEATSVLALRLLAAGSGVESRTRRWLALATAVDILVRESTDSEAEGLASLRDSREFARRTAEGLGYTAADGRAWSDSVGAALRLARVRMATLADDGTMRRTARLLRRCRRCGPRGAFAATHALHLLCNKVGFTIQEERQLFEALLWLVADTAGGTTSPTARNET